VLLGCSASFDTRRGFAAALLRMRNVVMALNGFPHPERERSEQSKDAKVSISNPGLSDCVFWKR
jgi:hypothetical protein